MNKIKKLTLTVLVATSAGMTYATPEAIKSAELVFDLPSGVLESSESPLEGWSMVFPKEDRTQYVLIRNDGRYIIPDISNPIIDLEKRSSVQQQITEKQSEYLEPIRAQVFESLKPLVKTYTPKAEIKHSITVFSEPGCIFCRKMHLELEEYLEAGIEVSYALFVPEFSRNPMYLYLPYWINKDSKEISDIAYGYKDSGESHGLNDLSDIEFSEQEKKKAMRDIVEMRELATKANVRGTPFILLESGKSISGYKPAQEMIKLLDSF